MDGATEARGVVLVAPSSVREARGGVLHHAARGHDHGLSERVLRAPATTGLLCSSPVADGTRYYDENDFTGKLCSKME